MDDPGVGVVWGKSGENLCCFVVILQCFVKIVNVAEIFKEIGITNSIGNVVLSHLFLSNFDCFQNILLEIECFSQANHHFSLLLVNAGKKALTMFYVNLLLRNPFYNLKFLQGQIMFQLPIEYLYPMQMDLCVKGAAVEQIVVLSCVFLNISFFKNFVCLFDVLVGPLDLTASQSYFGEEQIALSTLGVGI